MTQYGSLTEAVKRAMRGGELGHDLPSRGGRLLSYRQRVKLSLYRTASQEKAYRSPGLIARNEPEKHWEILRHHEKESREEWSG
jgi:hypothetical protein